VLPDLFVMRGIVPIDVATNSELIPGYRLLERLGEGGFGEVWKAEAPGGLLKAVKIIRGSLQDAGEEASHLHQELKALNRVRTVRHPFILSLERFEIVEGRLIIVMELADRSLWDRFQECRHLGLPGIPRDELLRYMQETAEALDVMNVQHDLQHLDIKPQNLFLLYNHVKVGDFGLVKDLEGLSARTTSGVTAVYAPPETFGGIVTRFSDQYNLAVAYQELLTGKLPFEGTNCRQLMMQHLMGEPDLRPLPEGDRPTVARALAKKPEDRHPSCTAFVQALRPPGSEPAIVLNEGRQESVAPRRAGDDAGRTTPLTQMLGPPSHRIPRVVVDREGDPPAKVPSRGSAACEKASGGSLATSPPPPPPPEQVETTGNGVLLPGLVVGLGGMGGQVLQQLRKALRKRNPTETWPHLRLLHLDTDPEAVGQPLPGEPDAVLATDESLLTRFHRPSHYLKRQKERQELEQWLPLFSLTRVPRDQVTARGWRALGRLAFVSAGPAVATRLREELEACVATEALAACARRTGLGLRTNRPRVYVATSLVGGTGGGMFLDVAYAVRRTLAQLGYPRAEVVGLFLLPGPERGAESARAVANAFAALTELGHFAKPDAGVRGDGEDGQPPFSRCVLLQLPASADGSAAVRELTAQAGDFLCRDLTTALGRAADDGRAALAVPAARMPCQTFGAFSFSVPRRPLLQQVAHDLCQNVVRGWHFASPTALEKDMHSWVAGQLARLELSPDCLTKELVEATGALLGQSPDAFCDAAIALWAKGGPSYLGKQPAAAGPALAALERLVEAPRPGSEADASAPLARAVQEAGRTVSEQAQKQLAELALGPLVEPRFRLTGTAEAVQRHIDAALGEAARQQHEQRAERSRRAEAERQRMQPLLDILAKGSFLLWGRKSRAADALVEVFQNYAAFARAGLLAQELCRIYQELQGNLHKYLHAVGCCNERVSRFLKSIADPAAGKVEHADIGLGRYLLPAGARTLGDAVNSVLASLLPEEEEALHETVQALIGDTLRSHVHLCTAAPAVFQGLKEAIDREVAALAETSLGRAHAAELYVEQHAADAQVSDDLAGAFAEAQPELAGGARALRKELFLLAVPAGPEGERFRSLVRQALPETPMLEVASPDDIVFYREQQNVLLTELPQLGPAAREIYSQVLATDQFSPHSREDMAAWLPGNGETSARQPIQR